MTLGEFFASTPLPKAAPAWNAGPPVIPVVALPPPPPPAPKGRPAVAGTSATNAWDNNEIGLLVALGNRPAGKFWADNLKDQGASADGNTHYWTFDATWVKSGTIDAGGANGTLNNGTQIEGALKLHFHPHAKETANYLHIKRSDAAAAAAGQISKTHWLVGAIGLTAAAVTPDGTQ